MHANIVLTLITFVSIITVFFHFMWFQKESFLPEGGTDDNLLYVPDSNSIKYPKEKKQLEMLQLLSADAIDEKIINNSILFQDPVQISTMSCPTKMNVIDSTSTQNVCTKNCSSPQDISPGLRFQSGESSRYLTKKTCKSDTSMPFVSTPASKNTCTFGKVETIDSISLVPDISDNMAIHRGQEILPPSVLPSATEKVENYYLPLLSRK
jgi:hypothetical protein